MTNKAVWPFAPLESINFAAAPMENRRVQKMDDGSYKTTVRSTARHETISAEIWLKSPQFAAFETWYRDELRDGTYHFLMRDPSYDGTLLLDGDFEPLLDFDGEPLLNDSWWLVRFDESPFERVEVNGAWNRVRLSLVRRIR